MMEVIAKIGRSKYHTEITTNGHRLKADEPKPHGGDVGPNPYEYLLTALGSCVAMTLRMYADRKRWDLEEVEVHLTQSRIHANDCAECSTKKGFIHKIEKKLKFVGSLSAEQRDRLLEISEKCPVHRTLTNEIIITTSPLS